MGRKRLVPLPWGAHQHAAHVQRYWRFVDVRGPEDCWPWTGSRRGKGYGQVWWFGRTEKSHRVAFVVAYGYWPENALHACDNPACCNPAHLSDGSLGENNRQMAERGRHWAQQYPELVRRGERHNMAQLIESDVREIREAYAAGGITQYALADLYGVTQALIWSIIHRRIWKHVR